ncbi:MAG TPA: hypothetical protein V6D47_09250 [Oscillatoriaceae cyanobacterium]
MNAYPFIPPLEPREVKELCRQIRVLRGDYPRLTDTELAEEWAERQQQGVGRAAVYADWIADGDWQAGFARALAFAARQTEAKQRARVQRQRYKEVRMDREPATANQQRYLRRLAKRHDVALEVAPEALSKLAASRLIQKLADLPGNPGESD